MGNVGLTHRTRGARLAWLYRRLTAAHRPLPDFLIVGAQRCGTSWTYRQLAEHPRILRAWRKEVHYFDRPRAFTRGPNWYRAHFPHTSPGLLTGEATPAYLYVPAATPRLAALLPDARLIVLLRDPVDRAYSQYQHSRRWGGERRSFEAALDEQAANADDAGIGMASYLARGLYADQLARLFHFHPRESVLVVRSEDLFGRPAEILGTVLQFLGLPPADLRLLRKPDARPYDAMPASVRSRLVEYFRPHNARLYDLLGRDLGWDH